MKYEVDMEDTIDETFEVPISWEALEDAFENNSPEVHSYLHLETGEVIRVVDGVADPLMHQRIVSDRTYVRIDPVSSREQYRWMEHFIATVEDAAVQQRLAMSVDGKGAFRRFKDVLATCPVDRERWFTFRSERLRASMEAWLHAHGIRPIERPEWEVPSAEDVQDKISPQALEAAEKVVESAEASLGRERARMLLDQIAEQDLELATAFLEFLRTRVPSARKTAKIAKTSSSKKAAGS